MIALEEVLGGLRFISGLPALLRKPVTVAGARATLRRRLEQRDTDFLALLRRGILAQPRNPYRRLLALAGSDYGDIESLVRQSGLEGALLALARAGVCLTADEFKGRQPIVRGQTVIEADPASFRNPLAMLHIPARSSGSRGPATPVGFDLASVRDHAVDLALFLDARAGIGWQHALWGVPGSAAMRILLRYASCGARPLHWFTQVETAASGLHPRYRWSARAMRWGSLLAGAPLPSPVYVPVEDPFLIVHWMAETLRVGQTPHLQTFASSAVRLCRAALDAGIDLAGARFTLSGEPLTAGRLSVIEGAGARAAGHYGSSETGGALGYGCLAPDMPDDLHFLHDLFVIVQPGAGPPIPGLRPDTLLVSSLRASDPFALLNVSLGDYAVMNQRACGCPLADTGWKTHIHSIRSHEKLTGGGMNVLDSDVIRVLDEVLPARFGGAPGHFQLVEEETEGGRPRLRLLVHPAIGPLDLDAVRDVFLGAIARGSGVERVMGLAWQDAGILEVERCPPMQTPTGKILHLHSVRGSTGPARSPSPGPARERAWGDPTG